MTDQTSSSVPPAPSDLSAPLDPIPKIDAESAMRWPDRISAEMMSFVRPFYGINLVDVHEENYDALYANIQVQQKYVKWIHGHLHFYSVSDHGVVQRIIWINRYDKFEAPPEASDGPNMQIGMGPNFLKTWTEFGRLAEGFAWWVSRMDSP